MLSGLLQHNAQTRSKIHVTANQPTNQPTNQQTNKQTQKQNKSNQYKQTISVLHTLTYHLDNLFKVPYATPYLLSSHSPKHRHFSCWLPGSVGHLGHQPLWNSAK